MRFGVHFEISLIRKWLFSISFHVEIHINYSCKRTLGGSGVGSHKSFFRGETQTFVKGGLGP